jgi:hypothetical protein
MDATTFRNTGAGFKNSSNEMATNLSNSEAGIEAAKAMNDFKNSEAAVEAAKMMAQFGGKGEGEGGGMKTAVIVMGVMLGLMIIGILIFANQDRIPTTFPSFPKLPKLPSISENMWGKVIYGLLFSLIIIFISISQSYINKYGQFTSKPQSIATLLTIRKSDLASVIDYLTGNASSVCKQLNDKTYPYSQITTNKTPLVDWRPLTVRLTGYLGGIHTARDGVFDMDKGIQFALSQGARAFVFDIDYLEDKPCEPVLIHRDSMGFMRSLNTGSIRDGCQSLSNYAFSQGNLDPVLIIIYLRRLPTGTKQKDIFFKKIAASLDPLSTYHMGSNEKGVFHGCQSEDILFTTPITNFQKKFIVMTNYDTSSLNATSNPKDNLHFWTNARIYQDPSGISESLGSVTSPAKSSPPAYATVGDSQQLLKIPTASQTTYASSSTTFKICLSDIEYNYTYTDLETLLNILGIQCVPLDVVRLSALKEHEKTIKIKDTPIPNTTGLQALSIGINPLDPLSYWAKVGWSRKYIIEEGFENPPPVKIPTPIPGFIIPKPIVPKAPSRSTNSNGGLVNIA